MDVDSGTTTAITCTDMGKDRHKWGRVWTPMELTGQNSFQIRVADVASDTSRDFSLDWIAVNVTYAP